MVDMLVNLILLFYDVYIYQKYALGHKYVFILSTETNYEEIRNPKTKNRIIIREIHSSLTQSLSLDKLKKIIDYIEHYINLSTEERENIFIWQLEKYHSGGQISFGEKTTVTKQKARNMENIEMEIQPAGFTQMVC